MPAFLFKRLVILSRTQRAAKAVNFHPTMTVITGTNNHLGKSSIIKTLLWTFGAESKISNDWKDARVTSLVKFELEGTPYSIFRDGSRFAIFDRNDQLLESFDRITSELGPYLASLLRFGLRLMDKNGSMVIPPPAFYFLPFYFNQDISWNKTWEAFQRLDQMRNWKRDVADYHVGIKPNAYYDLGGRHAELVQQRNALTKELDTFKKVRDDLLGEIAEIAVAIDLAEFEAEITEIILESEKIQKTADKIRKGLVELHNERILIDTQRQMVASSLKELSKDYEFLKHSPDHVDCPLCHASYASDFDGLFEIALDRDRCEEILVRLNDDLETVQRKIANESKLHSKHEEEIARIKLLLEQKRDEVSLDDLIDRESKRRVTATLKERNAALNASLIAIATELKAVEDKLKQLVSKERKAEILKLFRQDLRSHHILLDLPLIPDEKVKNVTLPAPEGGAYMPRAFLAYGFAILKSIKRNSANEDAPLFAPIIIDSPIQQEQDKDHHMGILHFIRDKRPEDSQMIIGIVDDKGVDFGGEVIRLQNAERSLLDPEQYDTLFEEIAPYWRDASQSDRSGELLL